MQQRIVQAWPDDNFWVCENGHSFPSQVGDVVDFRPPNTYLRTTPCGECGGEMWLVQRKPLMMQNCWTEEK